jgi:21S rRNA (GM2251-2'-O)-methyltransferase
MKQLANIAKSNGIKPKYQIKDKLDKFSQSKQHEGICLKAESRSYIDLKKFQEVKRLLKKDTGNLIVLVEKLTDPVTLGTISRTCLYLGVDMVVIGKENRAELSAQVAKVSNGASEIINLYSIKFMKQFIQEAQKAGWSVITTTDKKDKVAVDLWNLPVSKDKNYIILLSSEDNSNLSENTLNISDHKVYIAPHLDDSLNNKHPFNIIDSMNISVISGLLINHIKYKLKH